MKRLVVLMALAALNGCANMTPGKTIAVAVGAAVVAALIVSKNGDDDPAPPAKPVCHFVIGPNGSTQICN